MDNISFDLGLNSFRIDDLSAIMNDIDFCHPDIADRPIYFYFDDGIIGVAPGGPAEVLALGT